MQRIARDNRRDSLPSLERTLLWSMRAWMAGLSQPEARMNLRIEEAFAGLGAPGATGYLSGFMWAVRHGALRTIGVERPCSPLLDDDERSLLDVLGFAQQDQAAEATKLLRAMVTHGATWAALNSACRLGDALAHAGQMLPSQVGRQHAPYSLLAQGEQWSMAIH